MQFTCISLYTKRSNGLTIQQLNADLKITICVVAFEIEKVLVSLRAVLGVSH